MRRSLVSMGAIALTSLLFTAASAHADPIAWSYNTTPLSSTQILSDSGNSAITLTGSSGAAYGNSGIIVYTLKSTSTVPFANAGTPLADTFTLNNNSFTLSIGLQDVQSQGQPGSFGVVTFQGSVSASNVTSGSLLPGQVSWTQLANGNGVTYSSPTTASVQLGSNNYTISIASVTLPGQPNGASGSILADVSVTPGSGGGPSGQGGSPGGGGDVGTAPEPTSLLLAGLGLPLFFVARRRMKKEAV